MMRFFSIVLLFVFSGCGFIDDDIFLDDEQYEKKIASQSFDLEGMSIYGSGSGGSYSFSHRHRYRLARRSASQVDDGSVHQVRPKDTSAKHEQRDSLTTDEDVESSQENVNTDSHSIQLVDKNHDLRTLL